jgi:hypothetical protein
MDTDLRPAANVEPATWLIERMHPFAQDVGSVVPEGFDEYVRIFHPAGRRGAGGETVPVTWAEIAQANGRTMHPEMQFGNLVGMQLYTPDYSRGQPPMWEFEPDEGTLPTSVSAALVATLSAHTGEPGRCWFAVWDGPFYWTTTSGERLFGGLRHDVAQAPAFELPDRRYHLLEGPLPALLESCCIPPFRQSANLCWPDDRAWCIATEIDFMWTYVGGSPECIAEILDRPDIEGLPARIEHGITLASDSINPRPAE